MKRLLLPLLGALLITAGCAPKGLDPNKPVYVTVHTNMGKVTAVLYDDTPLHRDNFIKLCREGAYDSVIFHRIIKDFVVQGGDPDSKRYRADVRYGSNDGGYTVPAEIRPHHINKRGALLDAKLGDDVNPERASAGMHFCFMQGRVQSDADLDAAEVRINDIQRNWLFHKFMAQLTEKRPELALPEMGPELAATAMQMTTERIEESGPIRISDEQRRIYKTVGGAPHLDGSVTVFGEVVEGLDIVEKMSLVATDQYDSPRAPVYIISTEVFQK